MNLTHKLFIYSLLTVLFFFVGTVTGFAATLTVNTTEGDATFDGTCSFEEAINSINSGEDQGECVADESENLYGIEDRIVFDISGAGPHVINFTQMPSISAPVLIDGLSQEEAFCDVNNASNHDLMIIFDGDDAGQINLQSSFTTIQGVHFTEFNSFPSFYITGDDINLNCNTFTNIEGVAMSFDVTESATLENNFFNQVEVGAIFIETEDVQITNNVFNGFSRAIDFEDGVINVAIENNSFTNGFRGLGVGHPENLIIRNNIFNNLTNALGVFGANNGLIEENNITETMIGIYSGDNNGLIIRHNNILDSQQAAILLEESDNISVYGNTVINSNTAGIFGWQSDDVIIRNNIINDNNIGILVASFEDTPGEEFIENFTIIENSMTGNSISIDLVIDTGNDNDFEDLIQVGQNDNVPGDVDNGPNRNQNNPVITSAVAGDGQVTITYEVDFQPGDYYIEFYINPSNQGSLNRNLEEFKDSIIINHIGGLQTYSIEFLAEEGDVITSTATRLQSVDPLIYGGTSEVGNAFIASTPSPTRRRSSGGRVSDEFLEQAGITLANRPAPSVQDRNAQIIALISNIERGPDGRITQAGFIQFIMGLISILR